MGRIWFGKSESIKLSTSQTIMLRLDYGGLVLICLMQISGSIYNN